MFERMRNIETAFRHIRLFSVVFLVGCVVTSVVVTFYSYNLAKKSQQTVFILANGKALEAYASDRKDNIPVEAKDHVKMFHHYFFSLDPDEKVIQTNITKALYLADKSAKQQYDNLKSNSYYANVISGNVSQEIQMDSFYVNLDSYPYYFKYTGTQKILRTATISIRSLITEGYLRNVTRSDNNSHGFLIEKWQIIENKDITLQNR